MIDFTVAEMDMILGRTPSFTSLHARSLITMLLDEWKATSRTEPPAALSFYSQKLVDTLTTEKKKPVRVVRCAMPTATRFKPGFY